MLNYFFKMLKLIWVQWTLYIHSLYIFHELYRSPLRAARSLEQPPPLLQLSAAAAWAPPCRRRTPPYADLRALLAPPRVACLYPRLERTCVHEQKKRTKWRFQTQITVSKLYGLERNWNRRFMTTRSNRSKKKFVKRLNITRELKII